MYVLHVCAEVGDCLLRILFRHDRCRVHVPKGSEAVIGEAVQKVAQMQRARIRVRCLNEDSHLSLTDNIEDHGQGFRGLVHICIFRVNTDELDAEVQSHCDALIEFSDEFRCREIIHSVHARDLKVLRNKVASRGGCPLRVGRGSFASEDRTLYIIELDALHARSFSNVAELIPAHIFPVLY